MRTVSHSRTADAKDGFNGRGGTQSAKRSRWKIDGILLVRAANAYFRLSLRPTLFFRLMHTANVYFRHYFRCGLFFAAFAFVPAICAAGGNIGMTVEAATSARVYASAYRRARAHLIPRFAAKCEYVAKRSKKCRLTKNPAACVMANLRKNVRTRIPRLSRTA